MSEQKALGAITRREALLLAAGATIVATGGVVLSLNPAHADAAMLAESIKKMIGDKSPQEGKIELELPQIAENGNTVPVGVTVDSPMTSDNYVKSVHLFADGNPRPEKARCAFV